MVASQLSALFREFLERGMIMKKELAGMTIALVFLIPNFLGIVILPLSSISTTDMIISNGIVKP